MIQGKTSFAGDRCSILCSKMTTTLLRGPQITFVIFQRKKYENPTEKFQKNSKVPGTQYQTKLKKDREKKRPAQQKNSSLCPSVNPGFHGFHMMATTVVRTTETCHLCHRYRNDLSSDLSLTCTDLGYILYHCSIVLLIFIFILLFIYFLITIMHILTF